MNYSDNQQIFIGRLSDSISKAELKKHFQKYGAVIDVEIRRSYNDFQPHFGFVIFKDPATVKVVLDNKYEARQVGDSFINIGRKNPRDQRGKDRGGSYFRGNYDYDRRDVRDTIRGGYARNR